MALVKDSGAPVQSVVLGSGSKTGEYTTQDIDKVVEFLEAGTVTCTLEGGDTTETTVLEGSRYAIRPDVAVINFSGSYNVS